MNQLVVPSNVTLVEGVLLSQQLVVSHDRVVLLHISGVDLAQAGPVGLDLVGLRAPQNPHVFFMLEHGDWNFGYARFRRLISSS